MSKELKSYLEAKQKLVEGVNQKWSTLLAEAGELVKVMPDYVPPWNSHRHTAGGINSGKLVPGGKRKTMYDVVMELLPEGTEKKAPAETLEVAQIGLGLKAQGYTYTYNYIYAIVNNLLKEQEARGGFKIARIHPDGKRPSYYKVKAKENAVVGIGVTV